MLERVLLVVDAAIPVLVAAVVVVGELIHGGDSTGPVPVVLGVAVALLLSGRRRWPGPTLLLTGLLVLVLFHVDAAAGSVAVLAPAVALFALARRRGRVQQAVAGALAVVAVLAADVLLAGRPTVQQTLLHLTAVAIPLLAAEVIRTHQANVRLLLEQLELAERSRREEAEHRAGEERLRIARDLHDVLAHTLTEINVTAAGAAARGDPAWAPTALERIERRSHAALGELRGILGVLRGPDAGTAPNAPAPGGADIGDAVDAARRSGLDVHLDVIGAAPGRVGDAPSLAAYRIVQESLTNVRRHAPGTPAAVTLDFGTDRLTVTVDNGPPADGAPTPGVTPAATDGVGLTGMRERVQAAGGRFSAGPDGAGFRVRAHLPYGPAS